MTKPVAAAKPVHIFKPGRWTTMAGETIEFSEADLRATAAAFSPSVSKAPIVIGHPATDDPAQGWVASLSASERGLFAMPAQVDPAFAEAANAGRYGTVSAKFYRPTDASNPVPGVWYLRHVGVLGAQSPAVKGLDSPAFASTDDDGCVCFQEGVAFSAWDDLTVAGFFRNLREWFIGKFGLEEADKVLPGYDVRAVEQAAQDELRQTQTTREALAQAPAFSESTLQPLPELTVTPEEKAALQARNTELESQLAQVHAAQRQAQASQTHAAHVAFCEDLASKGKLLPAQQTVAVAALDHLAAQAEPVQFGEGDAQAPLLDGFKALLCALPDQVTFGESATHGRAAGSQDGEVAFAAPDGYAVEPMAMALHGKALAYQKANAGASYIEAIAAVS